MYNIYGRVILTSSNIGHPTYVICMVTGERWLYQCTVCLWLYIPGVQWIQL